ncbi:MAG: hypothetical protein QOJ73_2487 [Streptosporangiaceae bacterium]|nr:hypothetical protein [Streptosporangiaceae bacterium]
MPGMGGAPRVPAMKLMFAPPPVGAMRSRPQHHWDLNAGISATHAPRELCLKVGQATLALARESGGVALDMLGFPISSADDLLPR